MPSTRRPLPTTRQQLPQSCRGGHKEAWLCTRPLPLPLIEFFFEAAPFRRCRCVDAHRPSVHNAKHNKTKPNQSKPN